MVEMSGQASAKVHDENTVQSSLGNKSASSDQNKLIEIQGLPSSNDPDANYYPQLNGPTPTPLQPYKRQTEERNSLFDNEYECAEKPMEAANGACAQLLCWVAILVGGLSTIALSETPFVPIGVIIGITGMYCLNGVVTLEPNEAVVYQLCGKYYGTLREPGLYFVAPWYTKHKITVKLQNFQSSFSTVSDKVGNPIDIQAVIVWKIADSAKSSFSVENVEQYVSVQSESAIRQFAALYPYDSQDPNVISLLKSADVVNEALRQEVDARLEVAGIDVVEARISHLSYSAVIAQSMLKRQQAGAVIAARSQIVMGAVGMVKEAIKEMETNGLNEHITEERKADMVCTLLMILCSDDGSG